MSRPNGVNLQELQDAFLAIVVRLSGFHDTHVFWLDGSPDLPVPPRPYIAMAFLPPEAPLRAADDREFNCKPYHRVAVNASFTGTDYEITIRDTVYSHTALAGDSNTDVRDALVTLITDDVTAEATATATGTTTDSIDIEGDVSGVNLPVTVAPGGGQMTVEQFRGARCSQIMRAITSVVEISVWAHNPNATPNNSDLPTADDTAAAMVMKLLAGLMHKGETQAMRALGHIPKLVTSMPDLSAVLRDETENIARLDCEIETTLCHTTFGQWTTEMTAENESAQLSP